MIVVGTTATAWLAGLAERWCIMDRSILAALADYLDQLADDVKLSPRLVTEFIARRAKSLEWNLYLVSPDEPSPDDRLGHAVAEAANLCRPLCEYPGEIDDPATSERLQTAARVIRAELEPLPPPRDNEPSDCYVTLNQMAAIVQKGKRTLERLKTNGKIPAPDVAGGGGKHDLWRWSVVRPILETEYERPLPEIFPAARFVG
ncbi:MAG TPA: hypothetical protein VFV87_10400 [Pirellulaceae bacterium]|nr:hypothetical protein [Pirellulaceae bacterium]